MASLPPYSTYRTDAKQMMFPQATSHGNVLSFVPPGFKQELNVKFPDSRLAVCLKCKKNFKTRDMCRVRNTHTTAPWTTAYICITIDDSCLDDDGNYIDKPLTVRMVQWQPYCVRIPFGPKTPVCAACKRTNRTRSFCRERHKHKHLPWCTVYVLLSSLEAADPSTVVAAPSTEVERSNDNNNGDNNKAKEEAETASNGGKDAAEGKEIAAPDDEQEDKGGKADSEADDRSTAAETISSETGGAGDDIHDIPESRTFLAKVSCRNTSIHWLELSEFDSSEVAAFPAAVAADPQHYHTGMAPIDPSQYYGGNMGYAAQQHQNALKSRQQYFFQMQQHHQQHYAVAAQQPPPPPQWHPAAAAAYGHHPGGGEGTTAGEAAAAARRGEEMAAAPPQWAMYYPPPPPPHGHYPPPEQGHPMGHVMVAGAPPPQQQSPAAAPDGQDTEHQQEGNAEDGGGGGEEEQYPDVKRRRV